MNKFFFNFKDNHFIELNKNDLKENTPKNPSDNNLDIYTFTDVNDLLVDTHEIAIQTDSIDKTDISTQTNDLSDNLINYEMNNQIEITKLKNENTRLFNDLKEVTHLLHSLIKINPKHPEISNIKANLAVIVNREIRTKSAFPFIQL